MTFAYCPVCGTKAEMREIGDEGLMPYCETCKKPLFPFSYTCIITLVIDENGQFAFIQQYGLPKHLFVGVAGYTKPGERFEETVSREVFEEIGLMPYDIKYVGSYPFVMRDQMMVGYAAFVKHGEFKLSAEVDNAQWFTREEAPAVLIEKSIIAQLFYDYIEAN